MGIKQLMFKLKSLSHLLFFLRAQIWRLTKKYPDGFFLSDGYIDCDIHSRIELLGMSSLRIKGNLVLRNTSIVLINSNFAGSNLSIQNSLLIGEDAGISFGDNDKLLNSHLKIKKSIVSLLDNCKFINSDILLDRSNLVAGNYLWVDSGKVEQVSIKISNSECLMGDNVNLKCKVTCRNAKMFFGNNIFINQGTEIRCENLLSIGSNVFVSYECLIFDTNTHSLEPLDRIKEIEQGFPNSTKQTDEIRPQTAPVEIGDNVWIGMRAGILKGTKIADDSVVGLMSVVSGKFPKASLIVGNPAKAKRILTDELP